ncbi:MAG: sorbosone dehydrogenase family protein [Candidatus Eisenbacteria bacterium]|uniref:Sorbosone dehydrogenase family protein n=1 Tax=Eiseniibacteriota bacterium TaxID=2212470 RepID=A0A956RPG1_UNCEI|nr:sorbosone dehydrogenase family protein [Candidatus Eisenbacteria bacterium]
MRLSIPILLSPILLTLGACNSEGTDGAGDTELQLPAGFSISVFAADVPGARSLAWSPDRVLFVGTRGNRVYAIPDHDGDYVADTVWTIASGLNVPNGVAYHEGSLYIAEISRVTRYDDIDETLPALPAPRVIRGDLPTDGHHGWKFIGVGPDEKLYVPVGAPCNVCARSDERYASILRMGLDGSGLEVFAHGVRNTVGFDWDPASGDLWFTDNGRDLLGDDAPPDELNHALEAGMNFGFPYCHGGDILDPDLGAGHDCAEFTPPARKLGAHVAALGMRFYDGSMFPSEYRDQIFICEHGSWNRSSKVGYRITRIRLENGTAVDYQPFVTGWLVGESVSGRPVDLLLAPDGSLLVSDDYAGMIYRITYDG